MDDPAPLGVLEAGEHVGQHAAHLRQPERADVRPQRPPLEVLHRDERVAARLEVVVDRDDVRVRERARQPRLPQEP
jgi:hypothetical protein